MGELAKTVEFTGYQESNKVDNRQSTIFTEPETFRLIDNFDVVDEVDFNPTRQRTRTKVIVDTQKGSIEAEKSSQDAWKGAADDSDDQLEGMDIVE